MHGEIPLVETRQIPSEILYGAMELKENGWPIDIFDVGNKGVFGKINRFLKKRGINLISYSTSKRIKDNDIIIVKDNFSLTTTLLCLLLGKKIIYMDAMFIIPKRFWKRWSAYINLRLASATIAYSQYQAIIWEKEFNLKENHIKVMHYCVDTKFYPSIEHTPPNKHKVIAIGRDTGRDYDTLSKASRLNGIKVKLITLPYLLSEEITSNKNIQILQNIPYNDLFELYKQSTVSIIPLLKELDYPTGIRGILESLVIGMPTIASRTPVLEEYFQDKEDILFVDSEDKNALSLAMTEIINNANLSRKIATNGMKKARKYYNMRTYEKELETIIINVINT